MKSDISFEKLLVWSSTLDRTGMLPDAVSRYVSFLGRAGYRTLFDAMYSLLTTAVPAEDLLNNKTNNKSNVLRKTIIDIAYAMGRATPSLCPMEEAELFIGRVNKVGQAHVSETSLIQLLQELDMPKQCIRHICAAVQVMIDFECRIIAQVDAMDRKMTKSIKDTDMHQHGILWCTLSRIAFSSMAIPSKNESVTSTKDDLNNRKGEPLQTSDLKLRLASVLISYMFKSAAAVITYIRSLHFQEKELENTLDSIPALDRKEVWDAMRVYLNWSRSVMVVADADVTDDSDEECCLQECFKTALFHCCDATHCRENRSGAEAALFLAGCSMTVCV